MKLALTLMALRSFLIVTPETAADRANAAHLDQQIRAVVRAHRAETFRTLDLDRFLRRKASSHIAPRKAAKQRLTAARTAYAELDIDASIAHLEEALKLQTQGLASRKGAATWLAIRLELGLRLWETDDPNGRKSVAQTLNLGPNLPVPPGTQLSDAMKDQVEIMRDAQEADSKLRFTSEVPMQIEVAGIARCVSPCSVDGLPAGEIPWRATAPGFEAIGGVAEAGSSVVVNAIAVQGFDAFIGNLDPLWTSSASEGSLLLAEQKKTFPAPHLVWLRVGSGRVALLTGSVVPKGRLDHRTVIATAAVPITDDLLLDALLVAFSAEAAVGPPVSQRGIMHKIGKWFTGIGLPKLSLPSVKISRRAALISALTIAGGAAIAGGALLLADQPAPPRRYDPVLGF